MSNFQIIIQENPSPQQLPLNGALILIESSFLFNKKTKELLNNVSDAIRLQNNKELLIVDDREEKHENIIEKEVVME